MTMNYLISVNTVRAIKNQYNPQINTIQKGIIVQSMWNKTKYKIVLFFNHCKKKEEIYINSNYNTGQPFGFLLYKKSMQHNMTI